MAALETPGKPADTPEQAEIKLIRTGFHVVSANAGTGKTHTLAELILQLYLEEERKLYPVHGYRKHVGGDEQLAILRQIQPITFTRDAAAWQQRVFPHQMTDLAESSGCAERSIRSFMDGSGGRWSFNAYSVWTRTSREACARN